MDWNEDGIYMNKHNLRLIKITGKIITDVGNVFWRGEAIDETPLTSKVKGDVVILDDDDLKNWDVVYSSDVQKKKSGLFSSMLYGLASSEEE
jgi:hypothetical protein